MDILTTAELARRAGIKPSQLAYLKRLGLIVAARTVGAADLYDADQLRRVRAVLELTAAGRRVADLTPAAVEAQLGRGTA